MIDGHDLADYADMRRAMRRVNQAGLLSGGTCPDPGCQGTPVWGESGVVCGECDRWIVRLF